MKTNYPGSEILSQKLFSSRSLIFLDLQTSLSSKFIKRDKYFSKSGILVSALILCILSIAKVNAQWIKVTSGSMNTLFANGSTILAGMNGSLILGANSGTSWYGPATPGMPSGIDVRAINANSNYVFVGSHQSGLFRCVNDGNYSSWTNVLAGGFWSLLVNGSEIFAGSIGAGVYHSTDNGNNWTSSVLGMESYPYPYALTSKGTSIFAGMYAGNGIANFPNAGVYRSDDNGATWTQKVNGLTNHDVFSLAVKGNFIFAGTNGGIFRSADNGETWTFLAGGSVHSIKVVCDADIYVALLNNGGVSRSSDNGATWTGYNTGNEWYSPASTSLAFSGPNIFVGTLGWGVQKANIGDCPVTMASICGAKFNDLNGNANLDSGEPRLAGWEIQLSYNQASGPVVLKDTTDINGDYCFNNLQPGITYTVSEVNQPGWTQTFPAAPYNTYTVTALAAQNYTMFFGNKADTPASICGAKFNDLNGNADLDSGEPRLAGWEIQLSYNQASGPVVLKDTTDINGDYCFNNLQPGITYTVSEVNQPGWTQTFPAAPYNTYTVTALAAQNYTMFFGNKADPIPATICGAKFNDLNGNANLDSGEPRLAGWVIQLSYSQANGSVVLKDTTDANGNYCFNNLQPGITYTVSEVNQSGWTQTFPAAPYNTYTVTALAAQNYTMFFGNKQASTNT